MSNIDTQVRNICDEVQKSNNAQSGCIRKFKALLEGEVDKEEVLVALFACYDKVLLCAKKELAPERVVKFFSSFFSSTTDEEIFRSAMEYLMWRSQAHDKTARFRSLQTIATIMSSMSSDAEIAQDLWENMSLGEKDSQHPALRTLTLQTLSSVLLPRLRDKAPVVRLWAIKAVARLQYPQNDRDPIIKELIRLMSTDSSRDIRMAAVSTVQVNKLSLPAVFERIKDVRPEVRIAALEQLTKTTDMRHLKPAMRAQVIFL